MVDKKTTEESDRVLDLTELVRLAVPGANYKKSLQAILDAFGSGAMLRSAIPTTSMAGNTYVMSGTNAVGDYGAGAIYTKVGAYDGGPMSIQDANGVWFNIVIIDYRINVKHWGATGDGVTDDSVALNSACDYVYDYSINTDLHPHTVFFPNGHYKFPATSSLSPRIFLSTFDNITYEGEGYGSFYDCEGNGFLSSYQTLHDGDASGEGGLGDPTRVYYSIGNVAAGDQQVTTTTHAQAANFAVGDMLLIVSSTHIFNDGYPDPTHTIWTFQHLAVVTAVNSTTGVITLDEPISDKCTDSPRISNFQHTIARNMHFRNMRIKANYLPLPGVGMYKCSVENCWVEGSTPISLNGLTRSVIRDNDFKSITSSARGFTPAIEVKLGSHDSVIENNDISFATSDGTWPATMLGSNYGESARRIIERGTRYYVPTSITAILSIGIAQGIVCEDIYARVVGNMSNLIAHYTGRAENDDLPNTFQNIVIDGTGVVDTAVSLLNPRNFTIKNLNFRGTVTTAAITLDTFSDAQTIDNCLIEGVHINGPVGLATHASALSNVVIKDSSFSNVNYSGLPGVITQNVRKYGTNTIVDINGALIRQHATYTLANSASVQKLFNGSAAGAVTLPVGTYAFEALVLLTAMSATSGNAAFSIENGTGTAANFLFLSSAIDAATPAIGAWSNAMAVSKITPVAMATATGAQTLQFVVSGTFEVSGAGTFIPSITLANAAAAVVAIGSYFRCWRLGETTDVAIGNWS